MLTSSVFFKVRQNVINELGLTNGKNKLFCLSNECDEEPFYKEQQSNYNNFQPYNPNPHNIGYHGFDNNFLFNGNLMGNLGGMNNINNFQFYNMNMMINNPIKNLHNCVVPAMFNSGSSTSSGSSFSQQVVSAGKKKKSKKEKKKKAQKRVA
jgi:hypothetical protein